MRCHPEPHIISKHRWHHHPGGLRFGTAAVQELPRQQRIHNSGFHCDVFVQEQRGHLHALFCGAVGSLPGLVQPGLSPGGLQLLLIAPGLWVVHGHPGIKAHLGAPQHHLHRCRGHPEWQKALLHFLKPCIVQTSECDVTTLYLKHGLAA